MNIFVPLLISFNVSRAADVASSFASVMLFILNLELHLEPLIRDKEFGGSSTKPGIIEQINFIIYILNLAHKRLSLFYGSFPGRTFILF